MRLVFVVPRYGEDVVGGAETLCRHYAERLAGRGHEVRVLTTCARDHMTWRNDLRSGVQLRGGVTVERFPVTRPKVYAEMTMLHARLDAGFALDGRGERLWAENSGYSEPLLDAVDRHGTAADGLVFMPYLFAPTVFGVRRHPERSLVVPCLHDEVFARFSLQRDALLGARGLIFNSAGERRLAERLYGALPPSRVVGAGFDVPASADASRARGRFGLDRPYLAYAGRREQGKNFPLLLEWTAAYSQGLSRNGPMELAAMGSGRLPQTRSMRGLVRDLGFVSPEDKFDVLAGAVASVQLSLMESFSYSVAESWLAGTPVIVHADCEVTRGHCEESGGGLWARSVEEFAEEVDRLREDAALRQRLAQNGRRYVLAEYMWPQVLDRLERAVAELLA